MGIRATSEPSPSLIVRPLCKMPFVLVGARAYLDRAGDPRHPDDIADHRLVLPTYTNIETVTLTGPDGAFTVKNRAVLKTNDTSMALQLVRAGMGLAYFPEWIAEPELATGVLVRVLPAYTTFAPSVYAVYTSRKYMTTKVRTFIDFLSDSFNNTLS
ncbi:substrate binding domain-containing protein [Candidatus Burkholderia verschuerenii]|uniref:substrate binding domain-containing protein n=1 Tax=Candidatus Burkholderia verschuerenii TaxID=242163 RepID=UPI000B00195C|nr:substrate binding domain-containing protein [Candidatus Burkholderia verschuerenii]